MQEGNIKKRRSTISITDPSNEDYLLENINKQANVNILVDPNKELSEQEREVMIEVSKSLQENKLDTVICTAADFAGGNVKDQLSSKVDQMWKQNVWPSVLSAAIAAEHMNEGGMLCLSGEFSILNN